MGRRRPPTRPQRTRGSVKHDLPPLWDGQRVEWSPWSDTHPGSLAFHSAPDTFACVGCGWIRDTQLYAIGRIHPEPGTTYDGVPVTWPVTALAARRCPGCHLDHVTELETGTVWDLEPSDYTTTGSWPEPEGVLF